MGNPAVESSKLPPMLLQYLEYKSRYSDCLLFFQVGDFYELFFDDAVTVSRALNLTLTSRDKNSPDPIPMCGVPVAVVDGYLDRLISLNYSAAIVSQGAVQAQAKGPVPRALERIVTPGVRVLAHSSVSDDRENIVAAVAFDHERECALASTDVHSGKVSVREGLDRQQLLAELRKLSPAEVILPAVLSGQKVDRRLTWVRSLEQSLPQAGIKFRSDRGAEAARGEARDLSGVTGFVSLGLLAKRSVRLLSDYLDEVTVSARVPLTEIMLSSDSGTLAIDSMTRTNLELVQNSRDGSSEGSLLQLLNRTCCAGGARLLRRWILSPLTDRAAIEARLAAVRSLARSAQRPVLRSALQRIADSERIAVRLDLGVAGPRELAALRESLSALPQIRELLSEVSGKGTDASLLGAIAGGLEPLPALAELLERALVDQPPHQVGDGGVIRDGYDTELDRYRALKSEGRSWIAELEAQERKRTGIQSLKIKYNGVFGFFIEVTNANLDRVPADYIRRQTTANAERFVTEALKERERDILGADERALAREKQLFEEIRRSARAETPAIRRTAAFLAECDVLASLAEIADREGFVEPVIEDSDRLLIIEGRHPVLSALLRGDFVANSVNFGAVESGHEGPKCCIITGPNMGGKSTFLRQTALIVVMAQMGSFVPAKAATIGIVDRIFARIGASDNLREGESTFMVEMREASLIVANATPRSLVLIDEIGRGTATLDGLALAQAILEWMIVKARSRILFATHFHELTMLEEVYPAVRNLSVGSEERGESIIFTHQIRSGAASRSYGLEVAELAGLPAPLMTRARGLLKELAQREEAHAPLTGQLALFADTPAPARAAPDPRLARLAERISDLDPNSMTPLEALNALYHLKSELMDEL